MEKREEEVKEDVKKPYSAEKDYDCREGVVGSSIAPRRAISRRNKRAESERTAEWN